MLLFACVTGIGLVWVYFCLPETSGKSLESMDEIFNLPWYLIGRKGAELTRGSGGLSEVLDTAGEKAATVEMENAGAYEAHAQKGEQRV